MKNSGGIGDEKVAGDVFLPYDIILEIVSRLAAKDVLRFRCVCKCLMDLLSTHEFLDVHNIRTSSSAPPMILSMKYGGYHHSELLDKCWEPTRRTTLEVVVKFRHYPWFSLQSSHNGLIVSENGNSRSSTFYIFNPIYHHEKISITVPGKLGRRFTICGVFYHSSLKEYRTLWEITASMSQGNDEVRYNMLNLDSQPVWRDITYPTWAQNYSRIVDIPPVSVNTYLYWIVEGIDDMDVGEQYYFTSMKQNIMEFDTTNENLKMIPCPVPLSSFKGAWINERVLLSVQNVDGYLVFVKVYKHYKKGHVAINMWTLKDRVKMLWTSCSYYVIHEQVNIKKVIALWNEEIVFQDDQGLVLYNLRIQTITKFGRDSYLDKRFTPHVMSLASLKNCKSKIIMKEDENWPIPTVELYY